MNFSETKTTKISKPNFHTTLRVLHNLWSDSHMSTFDIEIILKDYGYELCVLLKDYMHVESFDGLTTYSLGEKK